MKIMSIHFYAILIGLIAAPFIFSSCQSSKAGTNNQVQDFAKDFSEKPFFDILREERDRHENVIRKLRLTKNVTDDLKDKYDGTREAYNKAIDEIIAGLRLQKSISALSSWDEEERIVNGFEDAEAIGKEFLDAVKKEKDAPVVESVEISWQFKPLGAIIDGVPNRFTEHCITQMVRELNDVKFKNWEAV